MRLEDYKSPNPTDLVALRRHVRAAHPNLLGDPSTWIGYAPLPQSGLVEVPGGLLHAVHVANHAGLYRPHQEDTWRSEED